MISFGKVGLLRSYVERGFNNRTLRKLKNIIGEREYASLVQNWRAAENGVNPLANKYNVDLLHRCTRLFDTGDKVELHLKSRIRGYDTCPYNPEKLVNGEITLSNIRKNLEAFKTRVIANYERTLPKTSLKSKTMEKLYSDAFKPLRRINEDGYHVTTLIDKKTGKPVEAYVRAINKSANKEEWGIYVKRGKEYELVGCREFYIDRHAKKIVPCWMDGRGHEEYAGIGLRAHQIGVERMMQEGLSTVEINAEAAAFPFHYKSGFRVPSHVEELTEFTPNEFYQYCSEKTGLPMKKIKSLIHFTEKDGKTFANSKDIEALRVASYLENNGRTLPDYTPMTLEGKFLEAWKKRAQSQPILL